MRLLWIPLGSLKVWTEAEGWFPGVRKLIRFFKGEK